MIFHLNASGNLRNIKDITSAVVSTGSYLPNNVINNEDLKQFPQNAIPLIESKTGVKSRRYASLEESTSDLATKAAKICLKKIDFDSERLDCIIVATSSPDRIQPATATRVQYQMGAKNAFAFDINSVCSGATFGICIADGLIRSEICENVLVIGSEVYSRILNINDFSTAPYFGDGAGAVLLKKAYSRKGVIKSILRVDGSGSDTIQIPAGGTMLPFNRISSTRDIYFKMDGKEVYKFAVHKGSEIINDILLETKIPKEKVDCIITHQANKNIIFEIAKNVEIDLNKFFINLDKYGNTAAASVLIGLDEALSVRKIKENDLVLLVSFGGGLSWGANLISI